MRTLCVSIHDVAPATWPQCQALAAAVAEVDERVPVTLLVVPDYHGNGDTEPAAYRAWLNERVARGDEIALHGYTHCDSGGRSSTLAERWRREIYTAREGEFSVLSRDEAVRRITAGYDWCAARRWRVRGFIAPAWLMSPGTWDALREFDFLYTTTLTRFHLLGPGRSIPAPAVVYSTRAPWRRSASRWWNAALVRATAAAPVVRLGLHPADARCPELVAHAQSLLERARRRRIALTKTDFAILAGCSHQSRITSNT
ncbi:MAG TPA: polysaccharide deacetylase family protein [Burkholderiales bacterium]|nr:polysaccharide deacetylase family protein [Burkholderiales bacterium]